MDDAKVNTASGTHQGATIVSPAAKRTRGHIPWCSLTLSVAALIVFLWPAVTHWLQYDRVAVATGEVWRLFTCHWTHWSVDHLIWDVLAFAILGAACERKNRALFLHGLFLSALVIPLVVCFAREDLGTYRGLSGVDSALFVLLALQLWREGVTERRQLQSVFVVAFLAGFVGKILFELFTGTTVFVHSSGVMIPVALAHVAGALVAVWIWTTQMRTTSFSVSYVRVPE